MAGQLLPEPAVADLATARRRGTGQGLEAAHRLGPGGTIDEIEASGLRGRGGAGFPTGRKWRGVRSAPGTHRYAVCNAAEGEPATFKDRAILRADPYQVVEGLAIAAFAVGASEAFIGVKASFDVERDRLVRAATEMEEAGMLGDLSVTIVPGPEEYLFGEEKALLEVIEGHDPLPRLLPPYEHGLFATAPQMGWDPGTPQPGHAHRHESNPTLVNNVETLAHAAHVLARGATWFRSHGTSESPGSAVVTVVGDVQRPGVFECDMGTPLVEVVARTGGTFEGRSVKAVLSGVANPVLRGDRLDVPLSYEGLESEGSGLGAAGFAIYDDSACLVRVALDASRFLYVESCNQCPACKLGTGAITALLEEVEHGTADDHTIEEIGARLRSVADGNRCYLPVQEQRVVGSILATFPEEFAEHLESRACPRPRDLPFPKLLAVTEHGVRVDLKQARKRPDWTYGE